MQQTFAHVNLKWVSATVESHLTAHDGQCRGFRRGLLSRVSLGFPAIADKIACTIEYTIEDSIHPRNVVDGADFPANLQTAAGNRGVWR